MEIMLRSLLKGASMGVGLGVGKELTGVLINHVKDRKKGNAGGSAVETIERDIQCGSCSEINTADSNFCGACGHSLVTRCTLQSGVKCACGFMNAQGQNFCSECGNRLV